VQRNSHSCIRNVCALHSYGDIGQATARLARAFKMRVVGLRRRAELSQKEKEEGLVVRAG
jgi:lactate dehydrogenase-like 2-hydroxyacid dehydrogenase